MVLRVGTDCSGLESPIQALKKLKIPFKHIWSADIDPNCIKNIKANFKPQLLFGYPDGPLKNGDITKRDNSKLPDIDLYVCGFPCQSFSSSGKRLGFKDPRGTVFFACLDVIKKKQPKMFVLENVRGLLSNDNGKTWEVVWGEITKLKKLGYNVDWKVLNTKDYGIPQNRPRVYIIGKKTKSIAWPNKCKMKDVKTFVDNSDRSAHPTTQRLQTYINKHHQNTFIEFSNCSWGHKQNKSHAPCVVRQSMMWCIPMKRYANTNELSRLQGIKIKNVVDDKQYKMQIGNSMSVNVLEKLFKCNL